MRKNKMLSRISSLIDLDDLTCIEMKAEYHQNLAITFFKEFQKKL